jgi:thiosulfate/3-mercaptopyruvate sulfurtransferase
MTTTSPLITVGSLEGALGTVTILDVRWRLGGPAPDAFAAGHLPGAAFVDLDADLASAPGPGGRHPLPTPEAFEASMRRAGVFQDRPVVVYDDWAGLAACRAWWLLRYHGHPQVSLLNGGLAAWIAEGGPLETGDPALTPGDFRAVPGGMPVVSAEQVGSVGVLIDARSPERFRGEVEPIDPVAGHIPGAVNVPTTWNVDNHGHLKGATDLAEVYAEVGVVEGVDVAAYCGSGVNAAQTVLALEVAGIPAALYPGSWSEWITDASRPIAR